MKTKLRSLLRNIVAGPGIAFKNLKMHNKMIAVFLFLITLPILSLSYVAFQHYSSASKTLTTSYVSEMARKSLSSLDDYITDLYNMSVMPLYLSANTDSENFLNYLASPDLNVNKINYLDRYLFFLNKIKPDTMSVYAFDNYGRVFYNVKSDDKRADLAEVSPKWGEAAVKGGGSPRLISTQGIPTTIGKNSNYAYYAFTVVRQLKSLDRPGESVGFVAFDTTLNAIDRWLRNLDDVTTGTSMLLDDRNHIVYASDIHLISADMSEEAAIVQAAGQAQGSFTLDGQMIIYETSSLTGWKLFVHVPLSKITKQASQIRNLMSISSLVIIAFALLISIGMTYALTSPLRKLQMLMKDVQRGNLNVRFQVRNKDEVGFLGTHFNMMINHIKELIEEIKWTQQREKTVELQSLQNQINPHFIYNTLESIRMTAEAKDDEEIGEMVLRLGKLLRYGIIKGDALVTIEDELNHLHNYVTLQNFRFEDRYQLENHIPDSLYRHPCIKLIFQPIVENALHHAFKQTSDTGIITITAEQTTDTIRFHITDNGCGMSEQALAGLNERLMKGIPAKAEGGIGLGNVNDRIKLHYGSKYGLAVRSTEGRGTTVTLSLPAGDRPNPYPGE